MDATVSSSNLAPFNPDLISTDLLEDEITELAACITVATARLLLLIAELDRREPWGAMGLRSCAHWLNWKCGIDMGAAREKVRVARALSELPLIGAAFACGKVSYSKVRAMTRVATVDNEEYLLMIARHGTAAHVERLVRGYRRAKRLEGNAIANEVHAARNLHWRWDDDGTLVLNATIPAEMGAVVIKALEAAMAEYEDEYSVENVSAETSEAHEPHAARRADALCRMAEQHLANAALPVKQADRYQVVLHVDANALEQTADPRSCTIEHGPPIADDTARRIACDASVVTMRSDDDGSLLDVGRKTRIIPSAIRRALNVRDHGCRFPGCSQHRSVDAHHVRHWADGGDTCLANLVLLCRHHHRLIHEGGFNVVARDDGAFLFFNPTGALIAEAPELGVPTRTVGDITAAIGIDVSAETLLPQWYGEAMDLGLAVAGMYDREIPVREVSA